MLRIMISVARRLIAQRESRAFPSLPGTATISLVSFHLFVCASRAISSLFFSRARFVAPVAKALPSGEIGSSGSFLFECRENLIDARPEVAAPLL